MSRYRLSEDALRDLEEIVDFVATDSVEASRRVLGDLLAAMAARGDAAHGPRPARGG